MKDMHDQFCQDHDTDFQKWMAEARTKVRHKRPSKKGQKARQSKKKETGKCVARWRLSGANFEGKEWLRSQYWKII